MDSPSRKKKQGDGPQFPRSGFLAPTPTAWAILALERWLPGPFEWFMMWWAPGHFAREIGRDDPAKLA